MTHEFPVNVGFDKKKSIKIQKQSLVKMGKGPRKFEIHSALIVVKY